jgi:hypothetical protein
MGDIWCDIKISRGLMLVFDALHPLTSLRF